MKAYFQGQRSFLPSRFRRRMIRVAVIFSWLCFAVQAAAQQPAGEAQLDYAPVEIDGEALFRVRGIEALPAQRRADAIAENIRTLARDPSFQPDTMRTNDLGGIVEILGGSSVVMRLTSEDTRLEAIDPSLAAAAYADRIRRAIVGYRESRTRASVAAGAARAFGATVGTVAILVLVLWVFRRGEARLQKSFSQRTEVLHEASRQILGVERLRHVLGGLLNMVRVTAVLLVALVLLQYVLSQFPWTRGTGRRLFEFVARLLGGAAQDFVAAVPNLVFLAILFYLTRYILSLARPYFEALKEERLHLRNFEPEWATPTYNLVRLGVIASAIVIAYPYIPGSGSDAFKGISILVGVLLSVGSSTAVANMVAGYMIVFRRAFRIGDRVDIGDVKGIITDMRLQVTHIRTVKNEEITLPNSTILGSEVKNYSNPARQRKLILFTEVGIGYEVPWRQVEAMLIEAADRTPNLLRDPRPFVLQTKLGDFAVTYQANAYTDQSDTLVRIYSDWHANILDVFNDNGVQIMTPAYEGDPEVAKIVPKEQWFTATKGQSTGDQ